MSAPWPVSLRASSLSAISPLLEKAEGLCIARDNVALTCDNEFNVAETGAIPTNPHQNGPLVELQLAGANYQKIFTVPLP